MSERRITKAGWSIFLLTLVLVGFVASCEESNDSSGPRQSQSIVGDRRGPLFQTFASNLNHLEDFPPEQMLPQLRDYLNRWQRENKPEVNWERDPIIKTLPEALQELPEVKRIDATDFDARDMEFVMQCIWLRDIARTAQGAGLDEVAIASSLFDWTVRNLQIEPVTADQGAVENQTLSEILLIGRATAMERAWVFIQLCRQQGLNAVMLQFQTGTGAEGKKEDSSTYLLPAVRVKDELYLFDPRLGLPIRGPGDKPVATLSEVAADDALLRAFDLDAEHRYPLKSSDAQAVVALVEGSPGYLSRGMKLVESRLAGNEGVILTATPSKSIEELKKLKHIDDARLWLMPYEVLEARYKRTSQDQQNAVREMFMFINNTPLFGGRVRQFKGDFNGDKGAKQLYLASRPAQAQVDAIPVTPEGKKILTEMKQAASFWLGLIAFDQKDYPVAVDYLRERVLIVSPDGPWTAGARYNLGRTYEAMGEIEKAVAQYQLDTSPQSTGNRLRARRLLSKP